MKDFLAIASRFDTRGNLKIKTRGKHFQILYNLIFTDQTEINLFDLYDDCMMELDSLII